MVLVCECVCKAKYHTIYCTFYRPFIRMFDIYWQSFSKQFRQHVHERALGWYRSPTPSPATYTDCYYYFTAGNWRREMIFSFVCAHCFDCFGGVVTKLLLPLYCGGAVEYMERSKLYDSTVSALSVREPFKQIERLFAISRAPWKGARARTHPTRPSNMKMFRLFLFCFIVKNVFGVFLTRARNSPWRCIVLFFILLFVHFLHPSNIIVV